MPNVEADKATGVNKRRESLPGRKIGDHGDNPRVRGWPDAVHKSTSRSPHGHGLLRPDVNPTAHHEQPQSSTSWKIKLTEMIRDIGVSLRMAPMNTTNHVVSPGVDQPLPRNRPLPVAEVLEPERASLVLTRTMSRGTLVVSFKNRDSLIRVIQELLIVLSFSEGDPTGKSNPLLIHPDHYD